MKYGIYYAFWEHEWGGDFIPHIKRVSRLGFDILEVACGNLEKQSDAYCLEMKRVAEEHGIELTGGYGPRPEHDLSNPNPEIVKNGFDFYSRTFKKMDKAGIRLLGGALYSYWPVRDFLSRDKQKDLERSIKNMRKLADMASDYGIVLTMESLNRFEGYLINTAEECKNYVEAVCKPNVKVLLDTFHMNIEEDSIASAIKTTGSCLGHLHVGEANRRPPYAEGRMPWTEIGKALKSINYEGRVVMEPFIRMGGQVGADIYIWHDLSNGADDNQLDSMAKSSLEYLKKTMEGEETK